MLRQAHKIRLTIILLAIAATYVQRLDGATTQSTTLWSPYSEWSVDNPSWSGNPFDVLATVTFVHAGSGEARITEMFYAGGNSWKFRFTGTRTGTWNFSSSSSDPQLNGLSGSVTVSSNSNSEVRGFITHSGNKFARQLDEDGSLEGYLYNVYQDDVAFPGNFWDNLNNLSLDYIRTYPAEDWATEYLALARANGSNTLFIALANQWFKEGARSYDEHNSVDPELLTFEMLERVIAEVHSQGGHLHIWAWGDQTRHWTPVGVGGINGAPDRRLQRYIAARLGPLPGWTMGYGFDLEEWVSESQLDSWAQYLHQHMGWPHLLWARNRFDSELDATAYNGNGPESYYDVLDNINSNLSRPHLEEERFYYQRWNKYSMETTRRHFWWYAMAGGVGGHWGQHPSHSPGPYPNPEQLETHRLFWANRFRLGMTVDNNLTDGYALREGDTRFVFYKQSTGSVLLDLSSMSGSQHGIAIDTLLPYQEIDLGNLDPNPQTWTAPYSSDWAIAVGDFGGAPPPTTRLLALQKSGSGSGTVTSNPVGIDCGSDCSESFPNATVVGLIAEPESGSVFGGWSGDGDCSDGSVTMNQNLSCTAIFNLEGVPDFTLLVERAGTGIGSVSSNPSGINCGSDCQETYPNDTAVQLVATPETGSLFAGWTGSSDCADGSVIMSQDISCTAHFELEAGECQGLVRIDDWSTAPNTLYAPASAALGEVVYTDRPYSVSELSSGLAEGVLIQTANDDKYVAAADHLHLTLCAPAMIYVGYDHRASVLPTWLSRQQWSSSSESLLTSDVSMDVYERSFGAGPLVIGGNVEGGPTGAVSHYVIVIQPLSGVIFSDGLEDGDAFNWGYQCDQYNLDDPRCLDF